MEGGGCSTLPGRAGTSNAFSAAHGSRTVPVDFGTNVGTLELGALADRSSKVQTQLILSTDPSQGGLT